MGNENYLRGIAQKIVGSVKGAGPVKVVGLDMEEEREASFDEAVDKACNILGNLDAFVHSYTYEGMPRVIYCIAKLFNLQYFIWCITFDRIIYPVD